MASSKSITISGGDAPRLSTGTADPSRWGGISSGATAGTANEPAPFALPDRSANAPAARCSTAPSEGDSARAAASIPRSARVSRIVTESVPPRGGSTWASVRATRGEEADAGAADTDSLDRSAAAGSTYSSNTMRSAPLPMSREGG